MSTMHIADEATSWLHQQRLFTGWALCGARLSPKNGAQPGSPVCPKCRRKAGWK